MRIIAVSGLALAMALSAPAYASDNVAADDGQPSGDRVDDAAQPVRTESQNSDEGIIVTGSRIRSSDTTASAPVSVISSARFDDIGAVSASEVLNASPSLRPVYARTAGSGLSLLTPQSPNLFNLGVGRTLSLIDGRRMVTTTSGVQDAQVDSNIVPTGLINRVEVVQAGGAAVYGSGAIAGVVNYVLRDDFEGLELDAQTGISTYGDYPRSSVRLTAGKNFDEGRGNFAVDVGYSKTGGLLYEDRPNTYPLPVALTNPRNTSATDGIPATAYVYGLRINTTNRNGVIVTGTGTPAPYLRIGGVPQQFNGAGGLMAFNPGTPQTSAQFSLGGDGYELSDQSSLYASLQRLNASALAHYDLTPDIRLSGQFIWAQTTANDPRGRFSIPNFDMRSSAASGSSGLAFNRNNPFLTPATVAALSAASPTFASGGSLFLNRALPGLLPSTAVETKTTAFRALGSLEGTIHAGERNFDWSASYSFAESRGRIDGYGFIRARLNNAINVVQGPNGPVCAINAVTVVDPACVPINIFGDGNFTPEQQAYVTAKSGINPLGSVGNYNNRQQDVLLTFGGDALKLPAGFMKFSLAYEHRAETAKFMPLAADQAGLIGAGTRVVPSSGRFNTDEFSAEVRIPLVGGDFTLPLVRSLEVSGSFRYVNDSLAGTENVWGAGFRWEPIEAFTVRGTVSRNFRAPTLAQILAPQSTALNAVTNPCSRNSILSGSNPTNRGANCLALFTANPAYGLASLPVGVANTPANRLANFQDVSPNQATVLVTSGGNPDLRNELSKTWTLGFAYQPPFIPGLSITADRIWLNLTDGLSAFNTNSFLATCFDSSPQPAEICGTVTYNANGTLATGQSVTFNAGTVRYRGDIYSIDYRFPLNSIFGGDGDAGTFQIMGQVTRNRYFLTSVTGIDQTRTDGTTALPSWRLHGEASYTRDRLRLSYSMDYLPAEPINFTDTVENAPVLPVEGNTVHNISVQYRLDRISLRAGINNFTNKLMSFPYSAGYGDTIGRQFFVGARVKY